MEKLTSKRAHNFNDLGGQRFGRLQAVSFDGTGHGKTWWICICDCGNEKRVAYAHLVLGLVRSCGCLRKQTAAKHIRSIAMKHGICSGGTPRWYQIWSGMMQRCYHRNSPRFDRYGGRGITVCDRWHNPTSFHSDMGDPPEKMSLDRIDNDAGYSPENCRWASARQQQNNRSDTRRTTFNGETMSASEWAQRLGITKATMYWRLRTWPIERALTEPPRRW
jgi:hypothetical protein